MLLYNGLNTCMIFDEATCSFALTPLVVKAKLQRCDIKGVKMRQGKREGKRMCKITNYMYCSFAITLLPSHLFPFEIFHTVLEVMDTHAPDKYDGAKLEE